MKCLEIGIIFLVIVSTVLAAPLAPAAEEDEVDGRLPKDTIPYHYDIQLRTDVHTGTRRFQGFVRILVDVAADVAFDTRVLTLHSRGLSFTETIPKVWDSSDNDIFSSNATASNDFLYLYVTRPLVANEKLRIEIDYTGNLQTNMAGFYRSSYRVGTQTRYLATTQFESTSARMAFPCYDEPELKATFKLTIVHHNSYNAISNMPETTSPLNEDYSVTTFEESPIMSTYLLAFIVSDFEYTTNLGTPEGDKTLHRVYARSEGVARTQYALARSYEFLEALETYVGYSYELDKMYSAAIPDFAAGAMENWGMITYKEQYLIGDENSHPREILDIHRVTAHELGHQFFGNVVTCKWWNYIWLNEGFATVFEYLLPELVAGELRFRDYFNVRTLQNALLVDSEETHPMTYDGSTNSRIIYDKSGSVIRMFQHAVGERVWTAGLLRYLQENNHKPVTPDDLYTAIEFAITANSGVSGAPIDFTRAFRTWETQTGYPYIHVVADNERSAFTITQGRYWAATESKRDDTTRVWYIPLNYATADLPTFGDTTITDYMDEDLKEIPFPTGFETSKWFIFNKQQIGLYRVNYDVSNWNALATALNSENFGGIHVLNRAQLIDDSLNLAADGYLEFATAFSVLNYLYKETDYIPWRAAVTSLDKIDYLLKGDATTQGYFRKFVNRLIRNMYNRYGVEEKAGDDLMTKFARETAIDWACRMGDQECLTQTKNLMTKALAEGTDVPASLEITYICNGLQGTDQQDHFVKLWNKMQASNDQSERLRLIDGLMCSNDQKVLIDFLVTTLTEGDETSYKAHERTRIFNGVFSKSPVGITATIQFLKSYYADTASTYGVGSINSLITSMSKRIVTDSDIAAILDLMDAIDSSLALKATVAENIEFNKNWLASTKYTNIETFVRLNTQVFRDLESSLRLQKHTLPTEYRLKLDVRHLHEGVLPFTGDVEIDAEVVQTTDFIQLHSKNQVIHALHVFDSVGNMIPIFQYVLSIPGDTLTIYFIDQIPVSKIKIHISYSSSLLTGSFGFYQTSYVDAERGRIYVGATQFEPTRARYAFPNFDEPGFKAVFNLEITHDESFHAIANMPEHPSPNGDGTVTTTFEPTPPMSSYLLAFVVSDLVAVTSEGIVEEGETMHRIWVRPDSISKANYALTESIYALNALEWYTGFEYKLPKVDSAGIPNKGGAMENWGMVTYRENAMIYEVNYQDISHSQKLSGVDVISHELAHQFFGDSVTCDWWDYIWLNEGFATLFEWHLMEINHPSWKVRHFFNIRTVQIAFINDARVNNMAMTPTNSLMTPDEISAHFDYVVYDKAGSVIRMFQNAVGESTFRAALSRYLNDNDMTAVTSDALVAAFETQMGLDGLNSFNFDTAFRSWERTPGYPMITVTLSGGQFQIHQEKYFTTKDTTSTDTSNWHIPMNFATPSNSDFEDTSFTNWFDNGASDISITAPADASQWFVFNKQQLGYYRVNYDINNWNALINTLNSENYDQIHVLNRAQLFDDAHNFAQGGYIDYSIVRNLLTYFSRETDYAAWATADRFISTLYTTFGPFNENLNLFVRHLSEKFYDGYHINAEGTVDFEELYERYGRELSTKLACNAGNDRCLTDTLSQNLVHTFGRTVPNGLQAVTFCNGFKKGSGLAVWVEFWKIMQSTTDATLKSQILSALGCTHEREALKDYLESTLGAGNSVNYTQTERRNVLSSVLNSVNGLEVVLNFFRDFHLDAMRSYGYSLEALLTVVARTIKDQQHYFVFVEYLNEVLEELGTDANSNIIAILNSNLNTQNFEPYSGHMQFIVAYLTERGITEAPTTTQPTTTATSTTTTQTTPSSTVTSSSTSVSSTPTSTVTDPGAMTTTTTPPTTTTTPPTTTTTGAPTTTTTGAPTTQSTAEAATESTTAGAASLSIQIAVVLVAFVFALMAKP